MVNVVVPQVNVDASLVPQIGDLCRSVPETREHQGTGHDIKWEQNHIGRTWGL